MLRLVQLLCNTFFLRCEQASDSWCRSNVAAAAPASKHGVSFIMFRISSLRFYLCTFSQHFSGAPQVLLFRMIDFPMQLDPLREVRLASSPSWGHFLLMRTLSENWYTAAHCGSLHVAKLRCAFATEPRAEKDQQRKALVHGFKRETVALTESEEPVLAPASSSAERC